MSIAKPRSPLTMRVAGDLRTHTACRQVRCHRVPRAGTASASMSSGPILGATSLAVGTPANTWTECVKLLVLRPGWPGLRQARRRTGEGGEVPGIGRGLDRVRLH